MPLIGMLTHSEGVRDILGRPSVHSATIAASSSWDRLLHLVRERPVTCAVLDGDALPHGASPSGAVVDLRTRFPSLAVIFLAGPRIAPETLLELGRVNAPGLVLLRTDELAEGFPRALARALHTGTGSLVTRVVSPYLSRRETRVLSAALDGVQRGWGAEDLAWAAGLTRAHLSVRLNEAGLPSAGRLLGWARMLHAGRWLTDPGRSAQSVSRQLEYANGATFRRALRAHVGGTPTQVVNAGGFLYVLEHFLEACDFERPAWPDRAA